MDKSKLLEDYCKIYEELNNMRNRVENLQNETKSLLSICKASDEKAKIIADFKQRLDNIRNDKNLKDRYKQLRIKQDIIKNKLINDEKQDVVKIIEDSEKTMLKKLISKYKSQSTIPINISKKNLAISLENDKVD